MPIMCDECNAMMDNDEIIVTIDLEATYFMCPMCGFKIQIDEASGPARNDDPVLFE